MVKEDLATFTGPSKRNVATCGDYLREFAGNYRLLIVLSGAEQGIEIEKRGAELKVRIAANAPASHDLV